MLGGHRYCHRSERKVRRSRAELNTRILAETFPGGYRLDSTDNRSLVREWKNTMLKHCGFPFENQPQTEGLRAP